MRYSDGHIHVNGFSIDISALGTVLTDRFPDLGSYLYFDFSGGEKQRSGQLEGVLHPVEKLTPEEQLLAEEVVTEILASQIYEDAQTTSDRAAAASAIISEHGTVELAVADLLARVKALETKKAKRRK